MKENKRIFLNIVATYSRSVYAIIIGLLSGRWTLMVLGEIDYGLNGLIGGLTVYLIFLNNVLAGVNARFYAVSVGAAKVAEDKYSALEECRRWFNLALGIHTVVPVVLISFGYPLGAYAIQHWLTIPADRISDCVVVFRFLCISCFIGMISIPFMAMYRAKQFIAELTIYSFITSTLNICFLYYMVCHPGIWLTKLAAWTCFLFVLPHIIICIRAFYIFPECRVNLCYLYDLERLKTIAGYSIWQFVGCISDMFRRNVISIIINKFFGAAMNAAQAIGASVQGRCTRLSGAMQGAFIPVIAQAFGERNYSKMRSFAYRTCKYNIVLSAIFSMPLLLELPEVMRLWLKNSPQNTCGLCICAMIIHLVDSCTTGHIVVIDVTGKIAKYKLLSGFISILTLPLAILAGLVWRNVYMVVGASIIIELFNSACRLFFARSLGKMQVRIWFNSIILPACIVMFACILFGYLPHFFMSPSFLRVIVTTLFVEVAYLPLLWFVLLSTEEREFVSKRLRRKIFHR